MIKSSTRTLLSSIHQLKIYYPSSSTSSSSSLPSSSSAASPFRSINLKAQRRSLASQTLLSRTDFEKKSIAQLRDELSKRNLITASKKKSVLIDKILEDERKRMMSAMAKSPNPGNGPKHEIKSQADSTSSKHVDEKPAAIANKPRLSEMIVSSPIKVVARLMSQPDPETPQSPQLKTGSDSSALASPLSNLKSAGHEAQTWPASINLPATPVEEPAGTVIPFIPDNWTSHEQSHASLMADIKPSTAGLQVSTASHPSTLPEGGPSLVVDERLTNPSAASASSQLSSSASNLGKESGVANEEFQKLISGYLKSISLPSFESLSNFNFQSVSSSQESFKFEDRPLNDRERNGLYQLAFFLGSSWILAGLLGH